MEGVAYAWGEQITEVFEIFNAAIVNGYVDVDGVEISFWYYPEVLKSQKISSLWGFLM